MSENREERNGAPNRILIPYILAVAGTVIAVIAHFIKYLKASSGLFTWTVSVFSEIMETFKNPSAYIPTGADTAVFVFLIAGVLFSVIALLCALTKKMTGVIVFAILGCLPFLMMGNAWIHYAGALIAIAGAVWYKFADR